MVSTRPPPSHGFWHRLQTESSSQHLYDLAHFSDLSSKTTTMGACNRCTGHVTESLTLTMADTRAAVRSRSARPPSSCRCLRRLRICLSLQGWGTSAPQSSRYDHASLAGFSRVVHPTLWLPDVTVCSLRLCWHMSGSVAWSMVSEQCLVRKAARYHLPTYNHSRQH